MCEITTCSSVPTPDAVSHPAPLQSQSSPEPNTHSAVAAPVVVFTVGPLALTFFFFFTHRWNVPPDVCSGMKCDFVSAHIWMRKVFLAANHRHDKNIHFRKGSSRCSRGKTPFTRFECQNTNTNTKDKLNVPKLRPNLVFLQPELISSAAHANKLIQAKTVVCYQQSICS